ncbi:hypothetical protein HPB47_006938 [Ixodes persulcatus]|uniref:Uncharacterized protein n=1 Tax=Ixodes persulcatus TaxID=34615 RepID=A0AC60P9D6_IXOPE|nr:hypothetical protein HPB47_006938 [Ixodes persulcatus]
MAPSEDACCICSRVFYGRQPRLRCSACKHRVHQRCLTLATEELTRLTSGVCVFTCDHCNGSKAARPTDEDARPSEETDADNGELDEGDGRGKNSTPSPILSFAARARNAASQEDDLGLPGRLLHGCLPGEENKRLRAETTRVSERQATLVCSLRDEVRACRAEIVGWRRAAGGAAPAPSNVPALILRNWSDAPSAHLLTPPPGRVLPPGLSEVPPAGNLPRWGSAGSSSGGAPASLGSVRDHRVNLTASQDGARDGRVARLEPMLPRSKARTAAFTGASETTKLCVASPSTSLRALFVTKLAPDTICEDVSSHLSSVGIDKVECRRLKTRKQSSKDASLTHLGFCAELGTVHAAVFMQAGVVTKEAFLHLTGEHELKPTADAVFG